MTTVELTDLTNGSIVNQEWQGTGVFDTLMSAVNKNIEVQYNKGRITGSDYAQVYTQSLQAVLQQAVQWVLQADTNAAQVDDIRKSIELKDAQLAAERNKIEAELEKNWGYQVTRDANGELVLGASTGEGKVDKEIAATIRQTEAVGEEIALKERQVVDQELTSTKQRVLLDTQEQAEQYKVDMLLPKELAQITAQVAVLELQDDELSKKILILEEQRKATKAEVVIKDKEAAKLGLDNVMKSAEADRLTNPNAVYTPKYGV